MLHALQILGVQSEIFHVQHVIQNAMDAWVLQLLAFNVRLITTVLEATAWPVLMELSVQ